MTSAVQRSIPAAMLLDKYGLVSLQQMGRRRGVETKGLSKSKLVTLLAKGLYDPVTVTTSLKELEPHQREVLDLLILRGGEATTSVFRDQLASQRKIDPPPTRSSWSNSVEHGSAAKTDSRKFEDILARLSVSGLVFTTGIGTYRSIGEFTAPAEYLFIPTAVFEHLPPVTMPIETAPPPPSVRPADPDTLLRDIYIILSFARDEPIPLTTRGQILKRALVRIDEALRLPEGAAKVQVEGDLGRLPLLRTLAQELGLLVQAPGGLMLGAGAAGFLAAPRGQRRRQLYETYRKNARWSELTRLSNLTISPRTNLQDAMIVAARQRVLAELTELPADEWIALSHLIERLRTRAFEFLFSRSWAGDRYYYPPGYQSSVYSGENQLGLRFERPDRKLVDWNDVEGGFIRVVVTEALYWLGMVDLGFAGEGEQPSAFRVTSDGALLLRGETPPSAEPEVHVVVQPNFQVFAFEPTGENVLFTLDRLAERVRAEQVVEYRLTRESVYAAQRGGMDVAEVLTFLEQVSAAPVPQNIRRSLEDWGSQHDRIRIRRATPLLQTIDEQALDALYADPELSAFLGRRIAPTAALVPARHLDALYKAFVIDDPAKTRPLPALSEGKDTQQRPLLTVDTEGRIAFRDPLPSIHVRHELASFIEEGPQGTACLTPISLRQGARSGRTPDAIVAVLQRFHTGPLPAEVVALVKRWAKDWGRGALDHVLLLQVETPGIMADLLAERELKRALQPLPNAPTLALVREDQAQAVRTSLEERGMELNGDLWRKKG